MKKEQAYEKLELPVGTDLHIVRQKFQQMHNEFQVQIDGAFSEGMRQKFQTRLMELEEAYKLLIGSEKADDSGSLPHTEKTFEQKRTEEAKAHTTSYKETEVIEEPEVAPASPIYSDATVQKTAFGLKLWYITFTIPLVISCAVLLIELYSGLGRNMGSIGQAFCWMIGTFVGGAIILNSFSPQLVPPYLRGPWFNGIRGKLILLFILIGSLFLVYTLYITGAQRETIRGIRWSHYIDQGTYILIAVQLLWTLCMGLILFIGLFNPSLFYFEKRINLFVASIYLLLYQILLVTCLGVTVPSAKELSKLSNSNYYEGR